MQGQYGVGASRRIARIAPRTPLAGARGKAYLWRVAGSALRVKGCIPVALSNSEGAGSGRILVRLPGAHLYTQVLGNQNPTVAWWSRHMLPVDAFKHVEPGPEFGQVATLFGPAALNSNGAAVPEPPERAVDARPVQKA